MSRDLILTSSPETEPAWPVPPEYVPLWSYAMIRQELEALITYRGHEAMPVMDQAQVMGLMVRIAHDYDMALAKVKRNEWALQGMLKNE